MKTQEENIEEGFEEVPNVQPKKQTVTNSNEQSSTPGQNRPDFRIVQTEADREGRTVYKNVGGMWRNVSKNGNEFYTLMIGSLKLLVFPNDRK